MEDALTNLRGVRWMHPESQRGPPMGNPYRIALYRVGICGFFHPQEPLENAS